MVTAGTQWTEPSCYPPSMLSRRAVPPVSSHRRPARGATFSVLLALPLSLGPGVDAALADMSADPVAAAEWRTSMPVVPRSTTSVPDLPLDVEPVGDWVRFDEVEWHGAILPLHLRTGYARPVIFPEPVAIAADKPLPGCRVAVDVEVVAFAPTEHFTPHEIEFVGERSGTRYRLEVRSDVTGERIPLRIVRP